MPYCHTPPALKSDLPKLSVELYRSRSEDQFMRLANTRNSGRVSRSPTSGLNVGAIVGLAPNLKPVADLLEVDEVVWADVAAAAKANKVTA